MGEIKPVDISVIIPAYNAERFIQQAISSVIAQTGVSLQLIVVDDGSTDGTQDIAQATLSVSSHESILLRQDNQGESTAINLASQYCRGRYLSILSADDFLLHGHCRTLVSLLDSTPDVTVAYPDWRMVDSRGNKIKEVRTREYKHRTLIEEFVCIPGPGAVFRKSAVSEPYLRDPQLIFLGDYEQWIRISCSGPFLRHPGILAAYRMHDAQLTMSADALRHANEILCTAERIASSNYRLDNLDFNVERMYSFALFYASLLSIRDCRVPGYQYLKESHHLNPNWLSDAAESPRSVSSALAVIAAPIVRPLLRALHRRRYQ